MWSIENSKHLMNKTKGGHKFMKIKWLFNNISKECNRERTNSRISTIIFRVLMLMLMLMITVVITIIIIIIIILISKNNHKNNIHRNNLWLSTVIVITHLPKNWFLVSDLLVGDFNVNNNNKIKFLKFLKFMFVCLLID